MTGYGRAKIENDEREISVEIKSVNHRFLDLNIKVPRLYAYLEDMIKKTVQQFLVRGKVDIYVTVKEREGSDIKVSPNMPVIESYLQAAKAISEKFGLSDSDIKLIDIMKLPDAISADKEEQDAEIISSQVESVLTCALNEYDAMRQTEGTRLCEDILRRGQLIGSFVDYIESRSPVSVTEYREKITQRMKELLPPRPTSPFPARILRFNGYNILHRCYRQHSDHSYRPCRSGTRRRCRNCQIFQTLFP